MCVCVCVCERERICMHINIQNSADRKTFSNVMLFRVCVHGCHLMLLKQSFFHGVRNE